ncbi:MAG: transporter [Candidatus Solibacter sp.]
MTTGRLFTILLGFSLLVQSTLGQIAIPEKETPPIQDNSFLVEEAYNQERGVVQHISTFMRMWNGKDWSFSFTQEWPSPLNWRHQLSYTLVGMHAGGFVGTGGGVGDAVFNYRYQLIGDGGTRFAFSPRVSMLFATGDATKGRSLGGTGVQINLPLSVVLHKRLVSHWNAGSTFVPRAQNSEHARASSVGYNFGQSFIFLAHPRLNLMLETYANTYQAVAERGKTQWARAQYISPGVRWAVNLASGLQIVPGVAVPIGIGSSAGEHGVFLYLSFEHPFKSAGR